MVLPTSRGEMRASMLPWNFGVPRINGIRLGARATQEALPSRASRCGQKGPVVANRSYRVTWYRWRILRMVKMKQGMLRSPASLPLMRYDNKVLGFKDCFQLPLHALPHLV